MFYKREIRQQHGSGANHLRWLMYFSKEFAPLNNLDKLEFIRICIYNKYRTWNNWLQFESKFRHQPELQTVININSEPVDFSNTLVLYMTFQDYKLPFEHYFHMDLGVQGLTPTKFEGNCLTYSKQAKLHSTLPTVKVLDCDVMFDRQLNQHWYHEVCNFFKFEDHFDQAQQVHELWYQTRKKSANDFCKYFSGEDFQKYILNMQKKYEH